LCDFTANISLFKIETNKTAIKMTQDSKLNPKMYKTFVPDQFKVGIQLEKVGAPLNPNFFDSPRNSFSNAGSGDSQPIRTLDFVRERLLNSIIQ
jgi:hypothetical protein